MMMLLEDAFWIKSDWKGKILSRESARSDEEYTAKAMLVLRHPWGRSKCDALRACGCGCGFSVAYRAVFADTPSLLSARHTDGKEKETRFCNLKIVFKFKCSKV
jgi:hypothetical protein